MPADFRNRTFRIVQQSEHSDQANPALMSTRPEKMSGRQAAAQSDNACYVKMAGVRFRWSGRRVLAGREMAVRED